jgi:drug/metabolite transporter (DMT)-like permease
VGEFLALLTAVFWAISVIFYRITGEKVSPFRLNLFKNVFAFTTLLLTSIVLRQDLFPALPAKDLAILVLSGVLGIGLSDLLFLRSLNLLGASRSALNDCFYSPFVILGSFLFFGEKLIPLQGLGGVLIVSSILLSAERSFDTPISRRKFWTGSAYGVSAMLLVAIAILMVKPLLKTYPLVWLNVVRLLSGAVLMFALIPFQKERGRCLSIFRPQNTWRTMIPGVFFGTYLSLLAWVAGFKYASSSIAALLNQTSTVFIVLLAALFLHEKMTRLKGVAVAVALIGVTLVLFA